MSLNRVPLDSEALRANLARTAQPVAIPERFLPLLEAVDSYYGVRKSVQETLTEYFHGYRNVDTVIDGLETLMLRNWSYFERSPDPARHLSLVAELVVSLLEEPLTLAQTSLLIRLLATWSEAALAGDHAKSYGASVARIGGALRGQFVERPLPFVERDALLRNLTRGALGFGDAAVSLVELYRALLQFGYARLAERLDVAAWAGTDETRLDDPSAVVDSFPRTTRERLAALQKEAAVASAEVLVSSKTPTYSELLDESIANLVKLQHLGDRFSVCLFFLKDDTLGSRQRDVMGELLWVVKRLTEPSRHTDFNRLLERLTGFFHRHEALFQEMRFQCYEAIGVAIGNAGAARAADHLIDDLLSWRFETPDIEHVSAEWETVVNPHHLPNIRCWLRIIESNPLLYERLVAALSVQLRLGGVFVADTDLFQRDISRLLNAKIQPIYFVTKQLLRCFPVYFSEIGAEGELRTVSTQLDEMCERRDALMHFLRKQTHAESSNRLVGFSKAVLLYWAKLDASGLIPYLPAETLSLVRDQRDQAAEPNAILTNLRHSLSLTEELGEDDASWIDGIAELPGDVLAAHLREVRGGTESARQKLALLVRLHQLLAEKYMVSTEDLVSRVEDYLTLSLPTRSRFASAFRARESCQPDDEPSWARDDCIGAALDVLEELKEIVADPAPTESVENIYHKRHIAAGIPSMYGSYAEPKFNALGLSFRIERLLSRLLEDLADDTVRYVNRAALQQIASALRYFERALAVDGLYSQSFSANIGLLDACLARRSVTFHQFRDIFRFLSQSVSDLSRWSILTHDRAVRTILMTDLRHTQGTHLDPDSRAEVVLREVVVSALGLQTLDRYIGRTLRRVLDHAQELERTELDRMMNFDPGRLVSWIHEPGDEQDQPITLGYKALGLKQLAASGYRIPEGFVLTTELFGALPAMGCQPLRDDSIVRIESAIRELEEICGLRMNDPDRLLTLSIRSGAAVSMPGLMMTFTNVGLNQELTEVLARKEDMGWTVWDSYRRFLQSWAMSAGIERDVFDEIIQGFKGRHEIKRKTDFTADQMRDIALSYKTRAEELGVFFVEDPAKQIVACVRKVLDSWNASQARLYRSHIGIAEDWGTSVIVQRMVLGNLGPHAGSGVAFTRDPQEPHRRRVCLFGDFAICSQGEDLVGGLVNPLPLSEVQRHRSPSYRGVEHSLERDFPRIYERLLMLGEQLAEHDSDPQEIEFTFESASDADLYLLQKRPMVQALDEHPAVFDVRRTGEVQRPIAFGVGVAGGAYAGRVAINSAQIEELIAQSPDDDILLLRPDTVPEDIAMIVRVQGILTARGGATSHAAITAKRLGRTAVVDCRALAVVERQEIARLGTEELHMGDWLSIDGRTGAIYRGRLPVARPTSKIQGGKR